MMSCLSGGVQIIAWSKELKQQLERLCESPKGKYWIVLFDFSSASSSETESSSLELRSLLSEDILFFLPRKQRNTPLYNIWFFVVVVVVVDIIIIIIINTIRYVVRIFIPLTHMICFWT